MNENILVLLTEKHLMMVNNFLIRNFLIALLSAVFFINHVRAQSAEEINSLLDKLLAKDFESVNVNPNDSFLVDQLLKKTENCIKVRSDSTLFYADLTIRQAEKAGLIRIISVALQLKGKFYLSNENFEQAGSSFIYALKIEEKLNNKNRIADLNDELGTIYYYQEIFQKSFFYHQNALSIYKELLDTLGQAKALSHLGSLFTAREYCEKRTSNQIQTDQEKALDYYQQSMIFYENVDFLPGIINTESNIGNLYRRMGQPEKALIYVEKALRYYREINDFERVVENLNTLALVYNRLSQFESALTCLIEAEAMAKKENLSNGIQFLYETLAQTYENLKDYKNSRDYYVKYMILRDSIYNNKKSEQIFELETKYQTEKKQSEIEKLNLIKKQRTLVIYVLIGSLMLIILLSYAYFRNIRNEKIIAYQQLEIKEKQLIELEKERQLIAARSVLQGEETERTRLAGDLHDGLGGLLAGVKLKLSTMKENAIITSENLEHFNHALDLLDTSINEMRRVAHNLMPETLVHYGLQTALHDFIQQVSPESGLLINFNTFGDDLRFNKDIEITTYRITQELITNALKHSFARQIDIQLFTEKERICVQVIDNGIGFDPEKPETSKTGQGLKNIRDRVTTFNGRFEILSHEGKGTESTLEFFIS